MAFLFLRTNPKTVLLGFMANFLSGFGQSFFLSLFTPSLLKSLSLSNTEYGLLYSTATLCSGILIPYQGQRLKHEAPLRFILTSALGFALACYSFAFIINIYQLWLTVLGLRFFGQGMFSHISATLMATRFTQNRGKALSIANLGYPSSEAVLPILAVTLMSKVGLSNLWIINGSILLFFSLLAPLLLNQKYESLEQGPGVHIKLREFEGTKNITFWYFASASLLPAFIFTALFLYHGVLVEARSLPLQTVAESFIFFAFARFLSSLFSGPLVDKIGSRKLFPLYLLPMTLGLVILMMSSTKLGFTLYLTLGGITQGASSTIMNSVWAEIYGAKYISKIRSYVSSMSVIGTAAGPLFFGLLLDTTWGVEGAVTAIASLQIIALIISWSLKGKIDRNLAH